MTPYAKLYSILLFKPANNSKRGAFRRPTDTALQHQQLEQMPDFLLRDMGLHRDADRRPPCRPF